jgi:signal transduction histidine kinase/AmiR/NasT family two-component response regulator
MADIIIADDESITLDYICLTVKEMGHNIVAAVASGPEAVEKALKLRPDIALLDIKMPGAYDGLEAGKIIQTELNIPVIYITAYPMEHFSESLDRFGSFGYLEKPFDTKAIRTTILTALFRSSIESRLRKLNVKYQEELENERIIREVLEQINLFLDPYKNMDNVLNIICNRVKCIGIGVYLLKGEEENDSFLKNAYSCKTVPEIQEIRNFPGIDVISMLKRFMFFPKISVLPQSFQVLFNGSGIRSFFTMPLTIDNNFYGIISYFYNTGKSLGIRKRDFLRTISNTISLIVKKQHDYTKIQKIEEEKLLQSKLLLRAEQLASLGQLAGAVSHEIRQPLQSIKILADSVLFWKKEKKQLSYDELLENFQKISNRIDRIEKIIQNLRMLTQSPEKIDEKPVQVNRQIREALGLFDQKLKAHSIKLVLNLNTDIRDIVFSEISLQQIIANLINNAVNALDTVEKKVKIIRITSGESDGKVFIKIFNNGPQINIENRGKIFEPFFSTRQSRDGMGLGLYLVRNILTYFHSSIDMPGDEKEGVTFNMTFNIKE